MQWLAALAGGLLLVLAFPPYGWWPLAPVSVAFFSLAVHGRRARTGALMGLVFGLAFFAPLLRWTATYVGTVAYLLAVLEAAFIVLLGAALPQIQRLPGWPVWVACAWVTEEALRDRQPFGGFPWGRLAFSQPNGPLLPFVTVGGAPLLTFVVALTGAMAVWLVLRVAAVCRVAAPTASHGAIAAAVAALMGVPVVGLLLGTAVHDGARSPRVTVAVVQGNVPRLGLSFDAQRAAVLRNHVQATLALAARIDAGEARRPRLVIWPENSSDIDPLRNPDAGALITSAARAVGVPILIGAILDGPGEHVRNAGIVWDSATGPGATYIKRHPVPFGEYMPLRSLARKVTSKADLVPTDMLAGRAPGALRIGGITIGDVICFEVAEDSLVHDDITHGAQLLVVQTNNATFGHSDESPQQLAMAQIRAVEHNRSVVVSSTSGISAVIGPDGTVRQRSGIFTAATFDTSVSLQSGRTLADRLGAAPEWVLTAIGVGSLLLAVAIRRRSAAAEAGEPVPAPLEREPA
ncbi:MAG: apolipoprotein N-acyltransferase [Mycobacteriales bacterium]|nr:MAG: apolipoprotein N-acyltransferase [Pseudonocardiales bacterium]